MQLLCEGNDHCKHTVNFAKTVCGSQIKRTTSNAPVQPLCCSNKADLLNCSWFTWWYVLCGRSWSACIVTEISDPLSFGKLSESILLVTLLKMLNDNIKLLNFEKDTLKFAAGFLLSYSDLFNFEKSLTSQRDVTLTVSEIDRVKQIPREKDKTILPRKRVHSNSGPPATGCTLSSAFVHASCSKLHVKNSNPPLGGVV